VNTKSLTTLFQQQRDPIKFLQLLNTADNDFLQTAWTQRLVIAGSVLTLLGLTVAMTDHDWRSMLYAALLLPLTLQICCGLIIMITHHPGFWLLYAHAPTVWLLALTYGLAPFSSLWAWSALQLITPFVLGRLLGDALAVGIHLYAQEHRAPRPCRRAFGVATALPSIRIWGGIRRLQYVGTVLLLGGLVWYPGYIFPGLSFLTGVLYIDAPLYTLLGDPASVYCDSITRQWHLAYAGRTGLWVPSIMRQELSEFDNPSAQSKAWITLAKYGFPLWVLCHILQNQSPQRQHRLLLALSLNAGGVELLKHLQHALSTSQQQLVDLYVMLAIEAEKPLELQGWLRALSPESLPLGTEGENAFSLLSQVHSILLSSAITPTSIYTTMEALHNFLSQYLDEAPMLPIYGWPAALEIHLKQQIYRYNESIVR
jgi:hypothetical protein